MIPVWWSIILTVIGVGGLYALTKKKWYGFALGLGAQGLWIAYSIATKQWGFIASAIAYGSVNIIGLKAWAKNKEAE